MEIKYIGNGSSGNSTFIKSGKDTLLIDNGLPLKKVPEVNSGILVSHSHSDHIAGIERYHRKYGISAIVDRSFYIEHKISTPLIYENFREIFYIKSFKVKGFDVWHDEPCFGFIINDSYLHLTDTGFIPFTILNYINTLPIKVIYIESNYDEELIDESNYDIELIARIKSKQGHLSNQHVLSFIEKNKNTFSKLSNIVIGHLSENTNSPNTVKLRIDQIISSADLKNKIIIGEENTLVKI